MSNDLSRVLSRAVQPSVDVPPFWRIRPPGAPEPDGGVRIVLEAGPGFGDGAHETTQLCLQAMAAAPRAASARMLDFGSGSGVLSIGAARLGLSVDAVEIDAAAIEHAAHNAGLNGVASSIRVHRTLDALQGPYALVVANILRPVLTAQRAPVSTLAVFVGVIGGVATFGFIGLVIGPVLLSLIVALLRFAEETLAGADRRRKGARAAAKAGPEE